jgi:hypothetical protein
MINKALRDADAQELRPMEIDDESDSEAMDVDFNFPRKRKARSSDSSFHVKRSRFAQVNRLFPPRYSNTYGY